MFSGCVLEEIQKLQEFGKNKGENVHVKATLYTQVQLNIF